MLQFIYSVGIMSNRPPYIHRNYNSERAPRQILDGRGFRGANYPHRGGTRFQQNFNRFENSNFQLDGFLNLSPSDGPGQRPVSTPPISYSRGSMGHGISHSQFFEFGNRTAGLQNPDRFPLFPNAGNFVLPGQVPVFSDNSSLQSSVVPNTSSGGLTTFSSSNAEHSSSVVAYHSTHCTNKFSDGARPELANKAGDVSSSFCHGLNPRSTNALPFCPMLVPPPWSSGPSISQKQDEKLAKLSEFLCKFSFCQPKKKCRNEVQLPQFRSVLSECLILIEEIQLCRNILKSESDDCIWTDTVKRIFGLKSKLEDLFSYLSNPHHLQDVVKKLQKIKERRKQKKLRQSKHELLRQKREQLREARSQELDKWLDGIKAKNLKDKREAEMKREADNILLEVRKKIHEAKKTIEKLNAFEKLRHARQTNAIQKGLHILPRHSQHFEEKMSVLRRVMLGQLGDYEAEERALRVMLETEQEEENRWKLPPARQERLRASLRKEQRLITQKLFGDAEHPEASDPLYLFHQFQTSATASIENLVNIRRQWDVYVDDNGEAVPQEWVTPTQPSDTKWEAVL